jgi:dTDP-4-dehydrorhamnose reductase
MTINGSVFVVGAGGRLGSAIVQEFADRKVVAHTRATLDITDSAAVMDAVQTAAPAVIINCAAYNRVDEAEDRPVDAFAINALAVRTLARAAEAADALFVHYGSDFVFDGQSVHPYDEEATPSPRSMYGLSKLLGDWLALDAQRSFVLRVESLFGAARGWQGRVGSLDQIVHALEEGRTAKVFIDRVVSPSYVEDIARATKYLIDVHAAPGLYHCVNSGCATWHDVAQEAARILGVTPRLDPIMLDSCQLKAPRPRFCALANRKLAAAGFSMPSWNDALNRWLASRDSSVRQGTIDGVHG